MVIGENDMKKSFVFKNKEQIEDFVRGCTFYGTGGGGDYDQGIDALNEQLQKGNEIGWVEVDDLPEGQSCCPFLMGSIAPETDEVKRERKVIYGLGEPPLNNTSSMVRAVKALEKITGSEIDVLVPIELGGGNTAACIAAAAELNIPVVNGDYTGRAIPEIQQTTPYIFEKTLLPIASCDWWENISTIQESVNWRMAERIGKMIADGGYSKCAQAGFLLPVNEMKDIVVKSTLTECYEVGKVIREAVENGNDPAEAAAKEVQGHVVFRGELTDKQSEDRQGYYWGTHTFVGSGEFEKQELKVWFKNENHVSWLNGEPYITSPDMLQIIDAKTGYPYTNNKLTVGTEVSVIAIKARPEFRTERGLEILSAKAFDFDIPYVPLEDILK